MKQIYTGNVHQFKNITLLEILLKKKINDKLNFKILLLWYRKKEMMTKVKQMIKTFSIKRNI